MEDIDLKDSEKAIRWIEKHLRIPEGKHVGKPFKLAEFQKDILRLIYDNEHITRKAIISMPRKSAKTTLCACIMLLHLIGPFHVRNSQIVSTALTQKQAGFLFDIAVKMVRQSPLLSRYINITHFRLSVPKFGTTYNALSSDKKNHLGSSPILAIHDEVGAIKGPYSELIASVDSGAAAHEKPLAIYISTQAATDGDFYSIIIDDALKGEDPRTVVKVYAAPRDVDPFSEDAIKYHPAWDSFVNQNELRSLQAEAKRMPTKENEFRNYTLNQRVEVNTPFINKTIWKENGQAPESWIGKEVYIGLDLSQTSDLTSLTLMFKNDNDDKISIVPFFYLPGVGLKDKSLTDRVPWDEWSKQGYLTTNESRTVDYSVICEFIKEINEKATIKKIAFDRYRIDVFNRHMIDVGFTEEWIEEHYFQFGQGFVSMSPAISNLENLILNCKLAHGNNPILTMCFDNVKVIEDAAGNRKFVKIVKSRKIDGAITTVMAASVLCSYEANKPKQRSYIHETGEFDIIPY